MPIDVTEQLQSAIQQIEQKGLNPTVARIKSHLISPVPMPLIISALQSWKKGVSLPTITKEERSEQALEARVVELEQQIASLLQRIEKLEQR